MADKIIEKWCIFLHIKLRLWLLLYLFYNELKLKVKLKYDVIGITILILMENFHIRTDMKILLIIINVAICKF